MRFLKLGFLMTLVVATRAGFAQSSQGYAEVSFGQLPAFFTGTRNGLDLFIAAEPGHRLAHYTLTIGGQTAHTKTFPVGQEPTMHTLHVTWDTTQQFSDGQPVAYRVTGETKATDISLVPFEAVSASRAVYNKRAVHVAQSIDGSQMVWLDATLNLYFAALRTSQNNDAWTAANYADDATGSIRMATHIVTYCHGHPGVLDPPGGGTVGAAPVTTATNYGQPAGRPPTHVRADRHLLVVRKPRLRRRVSGGRVRRRPRRRRLQG